MENFPWDQTVVGWIHITSAAIVAGGLFLWLMALRPGSDAAGEQSVIARFRPWFWLAAILLPMTGAFTWSVRTGQGYPGFYFHMVHTKTLLWFLIVALAGILTKPRPGGERRGGPLLAICVVLAVGTFFLSALMRRVQPEAPPTPPVTAFTSTLPLT